MFDPDTEVKSPKPPPIYVDQVFNIQPLTDLLAEIACEEYEIKILKGEEVKIQPKTTLAYRTIVKELQKKGTEFHTYKLKQDRSFRVVLKNIHPTTDVVALREAIKALGHEVTNVWNIKDRVTKKPLPIYFIDLKPSPENKLIYNVKHLLNCRIVFEAPRPKRQIPQCATCQRYGHNRKFCFRKPRCIKCAGDHATSYCPRKGRSEHVKFVLCSGNHPANYKGCLVYKDLQKTRYPALRPRNPLGASAVSKHVSYAAATNGKTNIKEPILNPSSYTESKSNPTPSNSLKEVKDILQVLIKQLASINNVMLELIAKLDQIQ